MEFERVKFRKRCDKLLANPNLSKTILARELGLDPGYFSKLYSGSRPVAERYLIRLDGVEKQLASGTLVKESQSAYDVGVLIKQIADLQETCGVIKDRLSTVTERLEIVEQSQKKTERKVSGLKSYKEGV